MNVVVVIGRITSDPQLQQSANGTNYVQFNLAVNGGNRTDFVPVTAFAAQAGIVSQARKGDRLAVTGQLRVDTLQFQDGTKRTVVKVVADRIELLDKKQQPAVQQPVRQQQANQQPAYQQPVQQPVYQQPAQQQFVQQPTQQQQRPYRQLVQQQRVYQQPPVQQVSQQVPTIEDFGEPVNFDEVPF